MLSDESQQQIEQLAREQQREPGEVLEEAVRRYAAACRLERFADKMGQRARDKGIREDVPRLVDEVRSSRESDCTTGLDDRRNESVGLNAV
jgi:predicted transcriptional regulator